MKPKRRQQSRKRPIRNPFEPLQAQPEKALHRNAKRIPEGDSFFASCSVFPLAAVNMRRGQRNEAASGGFLPTKRVFGWFLFYRNLFSPLYRAIQSALNLARPCGRNIFAARRDTKGKIHAGTAGGKGCLMENITNQEYKKIYLNTL